MPKLRGGPSQTASAIARAAAIYFGLALSLGFVLGSARVGLLAPRVGPGPAELIELPLMVAACAWLARCRVMRTAAFSPRAQAAVGCLALAMMLAAECALGYALQGRTPGAVLFDREPLHGTLYGLALLAFAAWPWVWARRRMARGGVA